MASSGSGYHKKSKLYLALWGAAGVGALALTTQTSNRELAPAKLGSASVFATPSAHAATPSEPLVGDVSLRGDIDVARAKREGNALVVKIDRSRSAVLTLDPAVQKRAEKVLADSEAIEGAVVVMNLEGELLALAGSTAAKPKARDHSLALEVWAPAASIFKIVTSAALLEAGVKASARVCYHGGLRSVESSQLTDNPRLDRNCGDFEDGLARSQNAIIAKLATKHLDREALADAADRLGFATAPQFALDVEPNRYQLPTEKLELARVAAGFWSTELSPIGAAIMTASIANGGVMVTPRVVRAVRTEAGVQEVLAVPGQRVLEPEVAATLGAMMEETCESGTARRAFRDAKGRRFLGGKRVAGKTGSLSIASPKYRGFSWFVGFAPADKPTHVIAVLLANPAKWRLKAHTAARLVLEQVL